MAIHGLCIIKNEADIIEQTLRAASTWCDHIYVFDNGSSDGTWEIVHRLASELAQIVPFKQDPQPFNDSLRGDILRAYKDRARSGDWWCILDADEFYVDDPRRFLAKVPSRCLAVWPQKYVYLFTDKDAAAFDQDPERFDRGLPIQDLLRHYVRDTYSELRFFRHDPSLDELPSSDELHPVCPERIRLRHYAYRSPAQIHVRLETRREPMKRGEFIHEKRSNWVTGDASAPVPVTHPFTEVTPGPAKPEDFSSSWRDRIALSSDCNLDSGDDSLEPPLPWTPPSPPRRRTRLSILIGRARRRVWRTAAAGGLAAVGFTDFGANLAAFAA
jgi:hypothetical protein